jgi:uncharacterized protein YjiS (DUF1127 family)
MYKLAVDNTSRESGHHRSLTGWGWTYPLGAAVTWLVHEWRIHRSIEQLRGFDDHMLKDIGLTRMEIEAVVRHGRHCDETRRRGWL